MATATDYRACEASFWYFLTHHCKALDPKAREGEKRVRLIQPYDYLYEGAEALQSGDHVHIVKSRQMVITTLICAFFLWNLQFRDAWSGLMTSRKEQLVSDGGGSKATWHSLFGRVLFMHRQLPPHLRHSLEISGSRIYCPARESYIVGESGNVADAGRGGVFSTVLMDEAAKMKNGESVFSAVNDASRQIIMNSTPFGKQGVFYRIYDTPNSKFRKLRMHWSRHPDRDQKWYEEQCRDRTPEDIAEELDCSFVKSVRGHCFPEFDWDRNVKRSVLYNAHEPMLAGCDFGFDDAMAFTWWQRFGKEHHIIGSMERSELIVSDFGELAAAYTRSFGFYGDVKEVQCWGDAEGGKRDRQTGISTIRAFREGGWNIRPVKCHERERIRRWRAGLKNGTILINPDFNGRLIECLQQLHYRRDSDGKVVDQDHSDMAAHQWSNLPDGGGYYLFKNFEYGESLKILQAEGV